ncbi:MAG: hypothetical protein AUJ85_02890 [Elusimicrobia bacterium CG1_02_37_114]|nr:MAG: hypothetical protein AUJ85_02890 [Elusimicrobia bacterium CG1_02_37_114]PIV53550.1 MAG: hypothetical protein COS17_03170 [Elusimicrobia bacterium CG02_land_8_20_14_3_00_37_13]PIZ13585.1 MAG: hypothetical protein COY53_04145 [Elusimicrobia bacterium CG_4_10_14_0_8_um_filter_37_32]
MKKIFILYILFWFIALLSSAPSIAGEHTGLEFLKISPSARANALAEAFCGLADDINALRYNPGGLGFISEPEIQNSNMTYLAETSYNSLGYLHPLTNGTFAVDIHYLSGPAMTRIEEGTVKEEFSPYTGSLDMGFGRKVSPTLGWGVNFGYVQDQITNDYKAGQPYYNGGLLYRTKDEIFSFGISAQNVGNNFNYTESTIMEKMPSLYRAGIALKFVLAEQDSDINILMEGGKYDYGPGYYAFGIEHWGAKVFSLKVGYRYVLDEKIRSGLGGLSAWRGGLGVRIKRIGIDYAFQPFDTMGNTHRVTLSYRFTGWVVKPKEVSATLKVDPTIFSPNGDGIKDNTFIFPEVTEIKRKLNSWELGIYDSTGAIIQKYANTKKDEKLPKIISWDGKDTDGYFVYEGTYTAQFIASGEGKLAKSSKESIVVDNTPPRVSITLSADTFSPDGDGTDDNVTLYYALTDRYNIDRWQIYLMNEGKKVIYKIKSTETITISVVTGDHTWDGVDDIYSTTVPNGLYSAELTCWDIAGNRASTQTFINVYIPPKVVEKIIERKVEVKEEARGLVVSLSSEVLFKTGKSELGPESKESLDEVVDILKAYPENNVLIEGYTDSSGSRDRNVFISSKRAWSVYSYLVKNGANPAKLKPKGYGPDRPIASNKTKAGRAKNRRVEIIIQKSGE